MGGKTESGIIKTKQIINYLVDNNSEYQPFWEELRIEELSRNKENYVRRISINANGKEMTLGSSSFFCKSWFKISTHSANLPD